MAGFTIGNPPDNTTPGIESPQEILNNLIDAGQEFLDDINPFTSDNPGPYLTGNRAVLKINGALFGFAFGVSFNIETDFQEIWTLDDYTPYELAPSKVRVNGTLSMFHIPKRGPVDRIVQPNVLNYLFHKYITIEIRDSLDDTMIFQTQRAMIVGSSQSLNAGSMSTIELKWKAIGWRGNEDPRYPINYDQNESEPGTGGVLGQVTSALTNLF